MDAIDFLVRFVPEWGWVVLGLVSWAVTSIGGAGLVCFLRALNSESRGTLESR